MKLRCPRCFRPVDSTALHICPTILPVRPAPPPIAQPRATAERRPRPARRAPRPRATVYGPTLPPGRHRDFDHGTLAAAAWLVDRNGLSWKEAGAYLGLDWDKLRHAVRRAHGQRRARVAA